MPLANARDVLDDEPLHQAIRQSALRLVDFLDTNKQRDVFEFPWFRLFPKNCCESVSTIFAVLLAEKFSIGDTAIIRGTDPNHYGHHFWVRARGRDYDLAAHQFRGHRPILGVAEHPLSKMFCDQQEVVATYFIDCEQVIDLFRRDLIAF